MREKVGRIAHLGEHGSVNREVSSDTKSESKKEGDSEKSGVHRGDTCGR